ncbi:ABC transporter ATP-binding protein [Corallococcus llansteffanensis]|uniref:ABC transporter ATP-binding protein n=1 Tax=Corallococcus llansteffanensis TaxID=2316731 RepID=A0A3A8PJ10_9BACT|nr:ABC transporter ATP-binding protein [Corallococcus llansteffanensis]RKH54621.1 ABC transporter ATP-binding protein [Corallococcus llansteffanensis]
MTSPLLQVEHLHVHQGQQRVLHEVGLEVRPGELWCILGPNGAGKSTLLRACMGMARPSAGTVRIDGRDLAAIPRAELARVLAWVPQYVDTSMGFTGLELVLMGRSPYLGLWGLPSSGDLQKAREVMRELGIEYLASRSVMATSGGERRLLLLARALVQAPRLMLLDEPTAFLDLKHQVELLAHLRERVRGGMAAVVVLHDVNLALACADRVLLLKQGAVLAQGAAGEILREDLLRALFDVDMDRGVTNAGQVVFVPRTLR